MATAEQIAANRRNAQHSTGPRSEAGNQASAANATTHGLTGAFHIHPDEESEFLPLAAGLRDAIKPDGTLQEELFQQILQSFWRIRRANRAEATLYTENPDIDILLDDTTGTKLLRIQTYSKREEGPIHRATRKLGEIQTNIQFRAEILRIRDPHCISDLCDSRKLSAEAMRSMKNQAKSREAEILDRLNAFTDPAAGPATPPANSENDRNLQHEANSPPSPEDALIAEML